MQKLAYIFNNLAPVDLTQGYSNLAICIYIFNEPLKLSTFLAVIWSGWREKYFKRMGTKPANKFA